MPKQIASIVTTLELMDWIAEAYNKSAEEFEKIERAQDFTKVLEFSRPEFSLKMQLIYDPVNKGFCINCPNAAHQQCKDYDCNNNTAGLWWTIEFKSNVPGIKDISCKARKAEDAVQFARTMILSYALGRRIGPTTFNAGEAR